MLTIEEVSKYQLVFCKSLQQEVEKNKQTQTGLNSVTLLKREYQLNKNRNKSNRLGFDN